MILNLVIFFLGRFAFRIVFILFGWAVGIFIGKTSARENIRIYGFTGISVLWSYTVIFGSRALLGFLPESDFFGMLIRGVLAAGILIFPIAGGIFLCGKKKRPADYALSGLKGFFYCPVMSAAFVLMMIFGIIITVKRIIRREETLFLEFRSGMSENELKSGIRKALICFGSIREERPPLVYSLPVKIFSLIREGNFCLKREYFLAGRGFRIFVNKDDLMIEGCKNRSHAVKIKLTEEFLSEDIFFAKGENCRKREEGILAVYRLWQKGLAGPEECALILDGMKTDMEAALFEDWEILRLRLSAVKERILEEGETNAQRQNRRILREK